MKKLWLIALFLSGAGRLLAGNTALTIYNQDFAVVRDVVPLQLHAGFNTATYDNATSQVEADSVVLRDPTSRLHFHILEQNYRADSVSQELLLNYFEGKTIQFQDDDKTISGKIIRSGYIPGGSSQPLIEVNGKLMFRLPGQPQFPALANDSILRPTLTWQLESDKAGACDAEVGYVTGGMSWQAAYNLVLPETGIAIDLTGWVTIKNQAGRTFNDAKIKLMAGNVNKIQPRLTVLNSVAMPEDMVATAAPSAPPVTEKAFDDFHLYTLSHRATLRDQETKQVEFVHANQVPSAPIYIYDGMRHDFEGMDFAWRRSNRGYGAHATTKVEVMREFKNAESNHLGMPLPAGRLRFYRRDADGQLEFIGENTIDHTPKDEWIRVTTGNAFDLVGERKRTSHSSSADHAVESFEIKLRNHKKEAVTIRVKEHLYLATNWEITEESNPHTKTSAQEMEFQIPVPPDGEKSIIYTVKYTW